MLSFPRYALTVLPTAAVTATFLLAGCSGSGPDGAPATNPSITFGAQASTTPGMAGAGGSVTSAPDTGTPTSAPSTPVGGPTVNIDDFSFAPTTLTIPAGSTVTWTNKDGEPHTVVANDGSFHSPAMDTNGTFSFTFPTAGTFDYVCSIHPFMHGTVVVTK
jgi:amicyanin